MGGLTDLCGVVNDSAVVNIAQPTGLEVGVLLSPPTTGRTTFLGFVRR